MNAPTPDQIKRGVDDGRARPRWRRGSRPRSASAKPFVNQLIQKAKEIAAKELGKPGSSSLTTSPLTSSAAARTRATTTLQRRIETELATFARGALGLTDRNLSSDQRAFSPEEKAYIKQVSADAATQATAEDNSPLGQYLAAAKVHIQISQIIARTSLDTRDELGHARHRPHPQPALRRTTAHLEKLALPGKPFQGFGLRRTVIFAPMPVKPENDQIPLQASPSLHLLLVRKLAIAQIRSLITREKILVLPEDMTPADPADGVWTTTEPAMRLRWSASRSPSSPTRCGATASTTSS